MGYYVELIESNVVLPPENHAEILKRWHEMNQKKYDHLKSGGRWSAGQQNAKWYSWMPEDYEKTTKNPADVLELLGFEFSRDETGIYIEGYDSKTGQEDLFLKVIASLIPAGSIMEWRGEDGTQYAWYFDGQNMLELDVKEARKKMREYEESPDIAEEKARVAIEKAQTSSKTAPPKRGRYNL